VFQTNMSTIGLGIVGMRFQSIEYGEAITIRIDEEVIEGVCCRATRMEDGGVHVGVQRADGFHSRKRFHKYLLKRFLDCDECEIPCEIVSADPKFVVIKLTTGAPFKVPKDKIKSRTCDERIESFRDENQLARFLEYYNLDTGVTISNQDNCDLIDTVVDLEFGMTERTGQPPARPGWEAHPLSK
jgi:hypothetical protein